MAAAVNLSNAQRVNGRIDEALSLARGTVDSYPHIYGEDHPHNYGCQGSLAVLWRIAGDPAEARRRNESALAGLDQRLTRNHGYSLTVATNLASDLAELGDTEAACDLGEDTWGRLVGLLGEDHPLALGCAANLAVDLRTLGADARADALLARTMSGYQATLPSNHPDAVAAAKGERLDFDFDPPPL
jgi:hypothetical protein